DGIRDYKVTGVQTCALPISGDGAAACDVSPSDGTRAYVAKYARGRDYHKLLRHRLQALCGRIEQAVGPFGYRVFCDSAPVMEVEIGRASCRERVEVGGGWAS